MKQLLFFLLFLLSSFSYGQSYTGFAPVGDYQLYFKVYGAKGQPLLLINGGPGFSSNYLDELAEQMSVDMQRTVILFDPRGTGKTIVKPINKKTINLRNQVTDIEALRKHLEIKRWDVIGHAYGGAIAMLYAQKYPNVVNKLVLSSSVGMNLDYVEPMQSNLLVRLSATQLEELNSLGKQRESGEISRTKLFKQRFDLLTEAYVFDKSKIQAAQDMITLETDFNLDVNQILWQEMMKTEFDIAQKMQTVTTPVLILHGRQDVIGESVPIYSHRILPQSKLVFINNAGRYLWLDQPETYFQQIIDFLN